ncbi:hypothetical protein BD289DRAFT_76525 [Coniella lustricola]|uniref:Zn(2)-C6 fungal-type domain-containing protein n=1 Tax=Coniella lustricola TaxID=2025994 RepID=A0A2T2ZZE8_9PEZI|nr:hypothetical protein BD289DRAFT_76525 [Coniella lustricola]
MLLAHPREGYRPLPPSDHPFSAPPLPITTMTELAAASMSASVATPPGGVARKKFAVPPVKSACLACRAARTRCDGAKPCATCQSRTRECVYLPSRRGGPRCRKKHRPDQDVIQDPPKPLPENVLAVLSQESTNSPQELSVQDYIDPGAGLKQLEDWVPDSDFIFDSLFMSSLDPNAGNDLSSDALKTAQASQLGPMVRTYQSDAAM